MFLNLWTIQKTWYEENKLIKFYDLNVLTIERYKLFFKNVTRRINLSILLEKFVSSQHSYA